jgi:hypothetical protein
MSIVLKWTRANVEAGKQYIVVSNIGKECSCVNQELVKVLILHSAVLCQSQPIAFTARVQLQDKVKDINGFFRDLTHNDSSSMPGSACTYRVSMTQRVRSVLPNRDMW